MAYHSISQLKIATAMAVPWLFTTSTSFRMTEEVSELLEKLRESDEQLQAMATTINYIIYAIV